MKAIVFIYIIVPLIILALALTAGFYRVSGDLQICRLYYPEMSLAGCYFSSKTVRIPGGAK